MMTWVEIMQKEERKIIVERFKVEMLRLQINRDNPMIAQYITIIDWAVKHLSINLMLTVPRTKAMALIRNVKEYYVSSNLEALL